MLNLAQHKTEFPNLAALARKFCVGAPATSVPSERLFSAVGDLYNEKSVTTSLR